MCCRVGRSDTSCCQWAPVEDLPCPAENVRRKMNGGLRLGCGEGCSQLLKGEFAQFYLSIWVVNKHSLTSSPCSPRNFCPIRTELNGFSVLACEGLFADLICRDNPFWCTLHACTPTSSILNSLSVWMNRYPIL